MPTPDEVKILKIIEDDGGESSVRKIAVKMGLTPNYARVILNAMGKNDIIDLFRSGKVRIAEKGWPVLGKEAKQKHSDGFKRYLEDRAKWKSF